MVSSTETRVEHYLETLSEARRSVVSTVRDCINTHLPAGYVETMCYGMIGWVVPLSIYPKTYNKQPLSVAALAPQKLHYAVYLTCTETDPAQHDALRDAYARAGLKFDMGKSCLRFKSLDGVLLDAVGACIAATPVSSLIARYEASRSKS